MDFLIVRMKIGSHSPFPTSNNDSENEEAGVSEDSGKMSTITQKDSKRLSLLIVRMRKTMKQKLQSQKNQ